jgi:hypothetical protein
MGRARQDLQYSADVQQVTDSLIGAGWNHVTSGSATVRGRSVNWVVSAISGSSQKIDVIVQRRGQADATLVYRDTITVFVAKSQLQ